MAALERANEIRLARHKVKQEIAAGRVSIAEVLDMECMASMEVEALLRSRWRCGQVRARKLLRALEISPTRRLDDLTDRQRRALGQACGRRS